MKPPPEGSLIELDAGEGAGHEQRGRRPALVVSVDAFQESGFAFVCPVTTRGGRATTARTALEVPLPPGLGVFGLVLSQQLRSVDWEARKCTIVGSVPRATLLAVRARLKAILGT